MAGTAVTEEQIREIARKIGEQPGVVQVWLFGSHATGTAGPDSDVDLLAVYEDEPEDRLKKMLELSDLIRPRPFPLDILVISRDWFAASQDVPGGLAYIAKKQGRIVYDRAS
ncbi:MAG: nucleotidyltransferase domain-containing protein [Armatimonadota bacterium]